MKDQKEWLEAFEQKFGRKPELEEFMKAKNNGFEDENEAEAEAEESLASEVLESVAPSVQELWLKDFEAENGRKPNASEFFAAKNNAFEAPGSVQSDSASSLAPSSQELWLKDFEAENGRKPNASEFIAAKNKDFISEEYTGSEVLASNATEEVEVDSETFISEAMQDSDSSAETEVSESAPTPLSAVEETFDSEESVQEEVQSESSVKADFSPKSLQERWLAYFEEVKGRKPNPDEFLAAKQPDFDMVALGAESLQNTEYLHIEKSDEDVWKEAFFEKFGRLPKIDEYSYAKRNDFSLKTLNNPVSPNEASEAQLLTSTEEASEVEPAGKKAKKEKVKKLKKEKTQKPKKSKKVPIIISSCIAFLLLVGLIVFGFIYYSKDNQLSRLKEALDSNNATKIAKLVEVDDSKFKVSAKNLKPFVDYLTKNPSYASNLSKAVENDNAQKANSDLYVEKSGSNLLIFPRYILKMNLVYPSINVARKGTTVSFAGKDLGKTTEDNKVLKPGTFVPASYNLDGKFVLNGQSLDNNRTVDLTRFSHPNFTQNLKLEFKFTRPTVRCNSFPDAEVWIDNKKVGQLSNGILHLPEMAYSSGMEIYLKKVFPSKTLESNHIKLTEGKPDITLDFTIYSGNISDYKTIINKFLYQYYQTSAGLTQNPKLIDFLENGASTPEYNDTIGYHFNKIKDQNAAYSDASYAEIKAKNMYRFDGYYYKYNQDAEISLVDISNNELVFNVNFSEIQYWNMYSSANSNGSTNEDGYQNFHWTGRQIIIDSDQAKNLLNSSSSYDVSTGYIKLRSFGKATADPAVSDPNINWSSLY